MKKLLKYILVIVIVLIAFFCTIEIIDYLGGFDI